MNVSIIGAGPAGCYTGYLLAKKGLDVKIYEEHPTIGEPLQCAGIVTSSIKKIVDFPDSIIINRIHKARIYSPNNKYIEFNLKNPNLILNRVAFDQWLAEKAEFAGAKIFLNHKYIGSEGKCILIKTKKELKRIHSKYLIGADGPLSIAAKSIGLFKKRRFWQGIQARVKLNNNNIVDFFPYIGSFAWIIPENKKVVRIGLLAGKNANNIFKKFFKEKIGNKKIINKQAGLVPIYNNKIKTQKKNVFLVGDAATMVKATSGGGLIQGLIASQSLAKAIINKKDYQKMWKKKLALDLWMHLRMRKILDKFTFKDYNYLTYLVNQKKLKRILETFDRDYPTKYLLKIFLSEPRLLYFVKKLI